MSAQSKAMYWQARAMELEAMVERMAEALEAVRVMRLGCCPKEISNEQHQRMTHHGSCLTVRQALKAYAAMKGGK